MFSVEGGILCVSIEQVQLTFTSLHCFLLIFQTIFVFVNVLLTSIAIGDMSELYRRGICFTEYMRRQKITRVIVL